MGRLFTFAGFDNTNVDECFWSVQTQITIAGSLLPNIIGLNVFEGQGTVSLELPADSSVIPSPLWELRGIMSNERYVNMKEKAELLSRQEGLGRNESSCACLIPISKNTDWWTLTQEERRNIFEEKSAHIQTGLKYLPAIARRLFHCRDLGEHEPFDFLTWFEYAPQDEAVFNDMLGIMRNSLEWQYVSREIDIRLRKIKSL